MMANHWMQYNSKKEKKKYNSPLVAAGVVHAKCETSPLIRPAAVKNITRDKNSGGISLLPPSQCILIFFWGKLYFWVPSPGLGACCNKIGWNSEIWLKVWNFVKIVKFGQHCEIWQKLANFLGFVCFLWAVKVTSQFITKSPHLTKRLQERNYIRSFPSQVPQPTWYYVGCWIVFWQQG